MSKNSNLFSWELFFLGAIALSILWRVIHLGGREFWYDEVLSLLLSNSQQKAYQTPQALPVVLSDYRPLFNIPPENSLSDFFHTWEKLLKGLVVEPHPPLFFWGQHIWLRLFGNTEAAMRSLETLYSVAAIGSVYGLGRFLLGHRGGLLLAALLGTSDYYLFHSLSVRMYAPAVLWAILSAWSLLELVAIYQSTQLIQPKQKLLWSLILIGSVTAGLMTLYLFAYYLLALGILALCLDKRHWWQYGWRLAAGAAITTPWVMWGTRQQLNNADLKRFASSQGLRESSWRHLQDILQTLGIHLVLGDWITSLPLISATIAGVVALVAIVAASVSLWHQGQRRILTVALVLGIFPLLLASMIDVFKGQFTVSFGWGRSLIFILPGCLLLLTAWLEKAAGRWRTLAAAGLLLFYLGMSVADFSFRQRQMFHTLADIINQEPTTPTLIALNSKADGHVLRLAYYLPPAAPVELLAQSSAQLAPILEQVLSANSDRYPRIIWLNSARPVWSAPKTEAQKQQYQQEVREVLQKRYQLTQTESVFGTSLLDEFTISIYRQSQT